MNDIIYHAIDFNALYRARRDASDTQNKPRTCWDQRAEQFAKRTRNSRYNKQFLDAISLEACRDALDVGCGTGNLAIPLASSLAHVYALDFSAAMLTHLQEAAGEAAVTNITPVHRSWEDSWDDLPKTDLVIASRSTEVEDMQKALMKLDAHAKRRVYLTYKVGGTFLPPEIYEVLGREYRPKPDYIYVLNILYQMGITATLSFIDSEPQMGGIDDPSRFVERVRWSVSDLSAAEETRLFDAFEDLRPYINTPARWALIGWEKP